MGMCKTWKEMCFGGTIRLCMTPSYFSLIQTHTTSQKTHTQAVSQLLTGVSLDTYLLRKEEEPTVAAAAPIHPSPAASPMAVDAAEGDGRERSDSDIARALQAQFDAGGNGDDDEAATQALIRQLQEQEGQGQSMLSALPSSSGVCGVYKGESAMSYTDRTDVCNHTNIDRWRRPFLYLFFLCCRPFLFLPTTTSRRCPLRSSTSNNSRKCTGHIHPLPLQRAGGAGWGFLSLSFLSCVCVYMCVLYYYICLSIVFRSHKVCVSLSKPHISLQRIVASKTDTQPPHHTHNRQGAAPPASSASP